MGHIYSLRNFVVKLKNQKCRYELEQPAGGRYDFYLELATERAMKVHEVILRALGGTRRPRSSALANGRCVAITIWQAV